MEQWNKDQWLQLMNDKQQTAFYIYTPMCGTCEVAKKMLEVISSILPELPLGMANINYLEELAYDLKIESVPCLIVTENGHVKDKIYAFKSVPYLYEILKNI